jgi:PAS domain S-box-containing protein
MLIEDDGVIARDLQDTLVELGFRVTGIATNADDALSLASRDTPDVALVDIRIQGPRDGIDTADELYKKHHVPVVFLSAYADGVTVARAKRASPFGYLVKPFRAAEIKTSIEVALYHAKMQRALAERQLWFETTISSLEDAIICTDKDDRVQLMNRAAEQLTGWSADDARGTPFKKVVELETPLVDAGRKTAAAAEDDVLGTLVRRRGGGETVVSRRHAPIVADGQTFGAVMVLRDTSEVPPAGAVRVPRADGGARDAGGQRRARGEQPALRGARQPRSAAVRDQDGPGDAHGDAGRRARRRRANTRNHQ